MKAISDILNEIKTRISAAALRSGRDPSQIQIVAVTKTHSEEVVAEALQNSLNIVGENKVQEAMWKKLRSPSGLEWHLIGHLQTNKVKQALETFDFIHSVDSLKLIKKIYSVADQMGSNVKILLEINVSGEKSKTGMSPTDVDEAVRFILEECSYRISLEGFMTMAPFSENPEDSRAYFRELRLIKQRIEEKYNISLPHLSMGMSGDFEVAIEEGATFVRLGTILFGDRPKLSDLKKSQTEAERSLDSYSGEGPTVKILD